MSLDTLVKKIGRAVLPLAASAIMLTGCGKNPLAPENIVQEVPVWETLESQEIPEDSPSGTLIYPGLKGRCSFAGLIEYSVQPNQNFTAYFDGNDLRISGMKRDYSGMELVRIDASGAVAGFPLVITEVDDPSVWAPLSSQESASNSADGTVVYQNIAALLVDPDSPKLIEVTSTNPHYEIYYEPPDLRIRSMDRNYTGTDSIVLNGNGLPASFQLEILSHQSSGDLQLVRVIAGEPGYAFKKILASEDLIITIATKPGSMLYQSFDPDTGNRQGSSELPNRAFYLSIVQDDSYCYIFGDAWNAGIGTLTRHDKRTGALISTLAQYLPAHAIALGGGKIYALSYDELRIITENTISQPFEVTNSYQLQDLYYDQGKLIYPHIKGSTSHAGYEVRNAQNMGLISETGFGQDLPLKGHALAHENGKTLVFAGTQAKLYDSQDNLLAEKTLPPIKGAVLGDAYAYLHTDHPGIYDLHTLELKYALPETPAAPDAAAFSDSWFCIGSADKIMVYYLE